MQGSSETRYVIAVSGSDGLFEFMSVRRSIKWSGACEFFAVLSRPHDRCNRPINAHASYHADGTYHIKTHEKRGLPKIMTHRRQKPDQHFRGTEHLLAQKIAPWHARDIGIPCDPTKYADVFEIPVAALREGEVITRVSADVVSPGYSPNLGPDIRIIRQREYQDAFPFIVVTLYEVGCSYQLRPHARARYRPWHSPHQVHRARASSRSSCCCSRHAAKLSWAVS
jgi:hypothetical protein